MNSGGSTRLGLAISAAVLLILTLLYWKLRIIDTAVAGGMGYYSGDLYNQYYPMVSYGFASAREGHLPLWNPFQMCGVPFLAVPYVGLFYPAHLIYLLTDISTGIELVFILHMFFACFSMWCLQRHFGISSLGGIVSAFTFAWSGWLMFNVHQIPLYAGMAWMPATVLLFDRAATGRRSALIGLIAAVAFQLLLGAAETLVHNLYAGALFASARLTVLARREGWLVFVRRGALLAACIAAGALLAAPQLLPTWELIRQSNRGPGEMTYRDAIGVFRPIWWVLFHALGTPAPDPNAAPFPTTGILPFLGIFLGFDDRKLRRVWITAVITSILALLLVSGDPFYRWYYALPWGGLFRRAEKFLSVYQFGQALLAGIAISQIQSWLALKRSELWTRPPWLAAFGLACLLCGFGVGATVVEQHGSASSASQLAEFQLTLQMGVLLASLVLFVMFGCIASVRGRTIAVVGLLVVQGADLFFATSSRSERPVARQGFEQNAQAKNYLRQLPGNYRTYLFKIPTGFPEAGFRQKDGMMNGIPFVTDYESLLPARYKTFFDRLDGPIPSRLWAGSYGLSRQSRWRMMSLTSTAYYVASSLHPANSFILSDPLMERPPGSPPPFHEIYANETVGVYVTPNVLPRAYLVPEARVVEDPKRLLDTLVAPTFDPRKEVLLEEEPVERTTSGAHSEPTDSVKIVDYQPEQVAIEASAKHSSYLVLTDAFYPGWTAFVDGQETKIYRANYLFRAVQIPAGTHSIRFAYRPSSFRTGLLLSALCAACLTLLIGRDLWSKRRRSTDRVLTASSPASAG